MTKKSLHDIIEKDLKKNMSKAEIVNHVRSMPKYNDLSGSTISEVITAVKMELNLP